jgi:hypothetical protein
MGKSGAGVPGPAIDSPELVARILRRPGAVPPRLSPNLYGRLAEPFASRSESVRVPWPNPILETSCSRQLSLAFRQLLILGVNAHCVSRKPAAGGRSRRVDLA